MQYPAEYHRKGKHFPNRNFPLHCFMQRKKITDDNRYSSEDIPNHKGEGGDTGTFTRLCYHVVNYCVNFSLLQFIKVVAPSNSDSLDRIISKFSSAVHVGAQLFHKPCKLFGQFISCHQHNRVAGKQHNHQGCVHFHNIRGCGGYNDNIDQKLRQDFREKPPHFRNIRNKPCDNAPSSFFVKIGKGEFHNMFSKGGADIPLYHCAVMVPGNAF